MRSCFLSPFAALTLGLAAVFPLTAAPAGTAISYQGQLNDNGIPANGSYEFRFTLHDSAAAGVQISTPRTNAPVAVVGGEFTTAIDFGFGAFNGDARFLEIAVRPAGSADAFTPLSPRQGFSPVPYALHALNAPTNSAALTGNNTFTGDQLVVGTLRVNGQQLFFGSQRVHGSVLAEKLIGEGSEITGVAKLVGGNSLTGDQKVAGTVTAARFVGDGGGLTGLDTDWSRLGNAGTTAGVNFLGTTDNRPLELRANNQRGLQLEYGSAPFFGSSVNVLGGAPNNVVGGDVIGATVFGGSAPDFGNSVLAHFGTVGGGYRNQVSANVGTVGGGQGNVAGGVHSTVGGGFQNQAGNFDATVAGGGENHATGGGASVGGGNQNMAGGNFGTVPGGFRNRASASNTFAAGTRANANHPGAFVWADSQNAEFASTANDQFNVRAGGGVRLLSTGGGLRLETSGAGTEPNAGINVIGGYGGNSLGADTIGATLFGGGRFLGFEASNRVEGAFSTVSGGILNSVAGLAGAVGGGSGNVVDGKFATIPGGSGNFATDDAFAAGSNAKARHDGTFVWADSQGDKGAEFGSTGDDQFLIRARNGVAIGTNNPAGSALRVVGTVTATRFIGDGSGLSGVAGGAQGPAGPKGDTGATGPQGSVGPAGPQGPKGDVGVPGAPGSIGATGPQGIQGLTGPVGPAGATGPEGPAGPKGVNWRGPWISGATYQPGDSVTQLGASWIAKVTSNGVAPVEDLAHTKWDLLADKGATGATGPAGPKGDKGDPGLAGVTGPQGSKGDQGDQGAPGAAGPQGPQGVAGVAGPTGLTGATGPAGPKGDQGAPGLTGATGPQGAKGDQGDAGPAGPQGPVGPQGPQGIPGSSDGWSRLGNAGTTDENFLGTTDGRRLELRANNLTGLRVEPNGTTPHVVGGSTANSVGAGSVGATIAGGGFPGGGNQASGSTPAVGGGYGNNANGNSSTVGGGHENTASGLGAWVGGGGQNLAEGNYAIIPGGIGNVATHAAFAAGRNAKAIHPGAFVWADGQNADFASTANDEFSVRAQGGMRLITGGTGLNVDGHPVLTDANLPANLPRLDTINHFTGDQHIHSGSLYVPNGNTTVGGDLTVGLKVTATSFHGYGGDLTGVGVDAANIFTGTVPEERLSSNIARRAGPNTFTGPFAVNTGGGTVSLVNEGGLTPGLVMTGGGVPGILRVRNSLEIWPNTGGTAAGAIDIRNAAGTATINLTGNNGRVTAGELDITGEAHLNGHLEVNNSTLFNGRVEIAGGPGNVTPLFVYDQATNPLLEVFDNGPLDRGLRVYGFALKNDGSPFWGVFSDERLKQHIRPYEHGLDAILKLKTKRFEYIDDPAHHTTSGHEEVGLIAQQVEQVIPEAVKQGADGYRTLDAGPVYWAAINAIQQLNGKVEAKGAEITALKEQNRSLEARLAALEKLLGRQLETAANGGGR